MTPSAKVLIVDDYPDALDVWEIYLQAEGFQVLTAGTGRQALECVDAGHPDLVVLDLDLPDFSGCEVARRLRADAATRELPLIAATGCSQDEELEAAQQAGFDLVLVKPCDPDALVREIRRLLRDDGGAPPSPEQRTTQSE